MMLIKLSLHSGDDDARVIGTHLDHGVPAYETGELTRVDWRLRLLKRMNENIVLIKSTVRWRW